MLRVATHTFCIPLVVITSRSFLHSWLITGFVTRLTRRVPLMEQELPTIPEHLSSPPVISGAHVTRILVLYVCFVDRCLSFCPFSFGHCVVCSSSIYGFWLLLWYLKTLFIHVSPSFFVLFTLSYISSAVSSCKINQDEQELTTLPEHASSPLVVLWDSWCSIFSFLYSVL